MDYIQQYNNIGDEDKDQEDKDQEDKDLPFRFTKEFLLAAQKDKDRNEDKTNPCPCIHTWLGRDYDDITEKCKCWDFCPRINKDNCDHINSDSVDSIVYSVLQKFTKRAKFGKEKYKTDLDRTDLNTLDWITHTQDELMDAILYLEKLKKDFENIPKH